jgi:hypothetical protein
MKRREDQEQETLDSQTEATGIRDRVKEFISQTPLPHQSGQNCKIGLVPPDHVPYVWEKVEEHLLRMAPHSEGELEPDDFFEALIEGDMQLWLAIENKDIVASMVTQIVPYPRKRVLRIISIGGDEMDKWIHQLPMVEDWALTMGCTSLECWGRKGWLKVLKDWKCSYHIITKDLTTRMH